jgi:tRNA (guanine-N7-)-methyltransferase
LAPAGTDLGVKLLNNVAFLITRVEFIDSFFAKDEVDEIWLTFSDPQPKDEKGNQRITSSWYITQKYLQFLKPGGRIHIKHNNPLIYKLAQKELEALPYVIETHTPDVYGAYSKTQSTDWQEILAIRTYYKQMWLDEGKTITYMRLRTPKPEWIF